MNRIESEEEDVINHFFHKNLTNKIGTKGIVCVCACVCVTLYGGKKITCREIDRPWTKDREKDRENFFLKRGFCSVRHTEPAKIFSCARLFFVLSNLSKKHSIISQSINQSIDRSTRYLNCRKNVKSQFSRKNVKRFDWLIDWVCTRGLWETALLNEIRKKGSVRLEPGSANTIIPKSGRLIDWLIDCSLNWLVDWLVDCLLNWLVDWLIDWLIGSLIDRLIAWLIDRCFARSLGNSFLNEIRKKFSLPVHGIRTVGAGGENLRAILKVEQSIPFRHQRDVVVCSGL